MIKMIERNHSNELCLLYKDTLLRMTRSLIDELKIILDTHHKLSKNDNSTSWGSFIELVKGLHHRHGAVLRLTLSEDSTIGAENTLLQLEQSIEGWQNNPFHQFKDDKNEQSLTLYGIFIKMIKILIHTLIVLEKEINAGWIQDSLVSFCLGLPSTGIESNPSILRGKGLGLGTNVDGILSKK